MSNKRYEVVVENIDNGLLNEQRAALRNIIQESNNYFILSNSENDLLEGLESLLDSISDKIYQGDCLITKIED